ncbi:MAG TPA: hypothetical protein PKC54_01755 [Ferruginibacter sp.]|nr:hypothetical protein [Ferruginibacter sp.]
MRYLTLFLLAVITLTNCKKVPVDKVIKNLKFSQPEIPADGQSTVNISVELSDKSSDDRRTVVFSTLSGVFTASGNNKYTAKAEYENGILVAKATLKASTKPGNIVVSVKPEFNSPVGEFILSDSIPAKKSIPFSIKLSTSSFGIASNHLNEVFITGKLLNASGKFVSEGYTVLFQDSVLTGPASGQYRQPITTTGDSSILSTYYSAFAHLVGTQIKIRATLLDENGNKTNITDALLLTVNQ